MKITKGKCSKTDTLDLLLWNLVGMKQHDLMKYWYWRLMKLKRQQCPYVPEETDEDMGVFITDPVQRLKWN